MAATAHHNARRPMRSKDALQCIANLMPWKDIVTIAPYEQDWDLVLTGGEILKCVV
eukprot:CAMPEP_0178407632 /NCGR_PEP_ID=MMETSP0689_2-20121128/19527_1 /TAXON_ID=160604 /ORGANISM="Amphidinium massartii, Strain CS-259" /LENGTH=55 /DNA_ID=CAMNT_0020028709 /DNA_START=144 /DNA_END=311 /DNA_ORIENTATION=+